MARQKKVRKLAGEELFEKAVRMLSTRSCSIEELRAKLRREAADLSDVERTIARLKDIGYLDDKRFAEGFASARRDNEGYGRFRVLNDLRNRRVPAKVAEQAVAQAFEGTEEAALLQQFIERRMPSLTSGPVDDERKLAAAYRKLRRAGFQPGAILAALKRVAARPEEINEQPEEDPSDVE